MTFRAVQVAIFSLLASLITGMACLLYTNHTARVSEQKWCDIVVTLVDANRERPPTTPSGQRFARALAELRDSFDCPPAKAS